MTDAHLIGRFDTVSPLDSRYYTDNPEFFKRLHPYVSEAANIHYLLKVELALIKALAKWGTCPPDVVQEVEEACKKIRPEEVYDEERRVQHNIRALVNCIRKYIRPESRPYVHLFATSSDIMDTASALRYKELIRDVLLPDLIELEELLIDIANKNRDQVQMGRTHGQHAVPTTFGYAMALFVSRVGSRIETINSAHNNLRGKFSGAVGAFNGLSMYAKDPIGFERYLLGELGLKPSETSVSSQIVEPEPVTDLVYSVISCFSILANLADDMRNLIRSEIGEIVDNYHDQEVGSSTMPHKMNPKNFENVKSLWKEFMPRMTTVFMDQISEHQRDLTNSASSRFLPEIFTGFCYAVMRMKDALEKTHTDSKRMKQNVDSGKDLVVAEPLYILLALQGYPDAYDVIRSLSRESRRTGRRLIDVVWEDSELAGYLEQLPEYQREILANPEQYIGEASARTVVTCKHWGERCRSINSSLKPGTISQDHGALATKFA